MDTIIGMFPKIRMATFEMQIHSSDCARTGANVWTGDRFEAWKSKGGGDFNVRSGEEMPSSR